MSTSNKKVAVVTGSSSGIGKATAELLKGKGFTVVGLSKRLTDGPESRRCDLREASNVEAVFKSILKDFGRIDVLVNCAGIVTKTPPLEISVAEWEEMFRINVTGSYLCCKYSLPSMMENRYGKIVNVSSSAGRWYSQNASVAYTASKYAVIGLTKQMALHFGPFGININCVCPSHTQTEMLMAHVPLEQQEKIAEKIPLKRLAKPEEVAQAIVFLASDGASYVHGAVMDINGGQF